MKEKTRKLVINAGTDLGAKLRIDKSKTRVLTFGQVTLETVVRPRSKANVAAGQEAFGRIRDSLLKPGVKLSFAKGVPLFRADPVNPDLLIRSLDGKISRGKIDAAGRFVPLKKKTSATAKKAA